MPFNNSIIGGTKLLTPAIRSPNYIAGVQGWSINRDGTVEFASGTFRGPVIVIDPVTQAVLASIGANGSIAGQTLSAANDIFLGNTSLADYLSHAGRGLVAEKFISGALPSAGNSAFADTAWIEFQAVANRYYWIHTTPMEIVNPGASHKLEFRLDMTSTDGGFNGTAITTRVDVNTVETIYPGFMFFSSVDCTQRVQLKLNSTSSVMTVPNTGNSFKFFVLDVAGNPSHVGGSGTASGAQTFTKDYICTASKSYDGSGNFIGSPDGDNNVYTSQFPDRSFGNERAYLIFPNSTIRADLAGATVNSARAYFYCFKAEETNGSIGLKSEASGSLPSTYSPSTGSDDVSKADSWPVPGWDSINIVGALLTKILAGDNGIGMPPVIFGLAATGFRGFGFDSTLRPFIRITFTK